MGQPQIARMYVLHRAFRREFGLLPGAVAAVKDGDGRRSAAVSGHVLVLLGLLQDHQDRGSRLVRPWLRERIRPQPTATGQEQLPTATGQDQLLATSGQERLLDAVSEQLEVFDALLDVLVADLGGWAGEADRWTRDRLVRTGTVLEGTTAAEAAWFRAGQSVTGRLLWLLVGRPAYLRHIRAMRGPTGDDEPLDRPSPSPQRLCAQAP
jgi:hypothetical protein